MRRLLVTFPLVAGCTAGISDVDPHPYRVDVASCKFENEGDSPDEYDPDQDESYVFTEAANFPKGKNTGFIKKSQSYVKIATSVDPTYRTMAYVDQVGFPYDRNWYMFVHFGDGLQRFAAYAYIKGGEFWDDDIEWFKLKIKMTSVDGDTCTSKSRTVRIDD